MAISTPPTDETPARDALAHALADDLQTFAASVAESQSAEALHQLRVTLRKVRALVSTSKDVLSQEHLSHIKIGIRWLSDLTGPARDADVQLHHHEDETHTLPEETVKKLEARRLQSYGKIRDALASDQFREFCMRIEQIADAEGADESLTPEALCEQVQKLLKKATKLGELLTAASSDSEFHELRKLLKKLRYTLGFLVQNAPEKRFMKAEKQLKVIQDYLGHFQDQTVRAGELESRAAEIIGTGDPEKREILETGVRIGQTRQTIHYLKAGFPKVFDKFNKGMRRHL